MCLSLLSYICAEVEIPRLFREKNKEKNQENLEIESV
jgi:hypothetical protein